MNLAKEKRDYFFDNLKGLLIILVVFGHAIEYMAFTNDNTIVKGIYAAIYTFHMPVFIFISGYFSKKNKTERILELGLIYAIWQCFLYPGLVSICTNTSFSSNLKSIFMPDYVLWYILSLAIWKMLTPYLSKIKHIFIVSIILGLLVGLSPGKVSLSYMSVGRIVAFYPFFLLGFFCTKDKFYKLKSSLNKWVGLFLLLIVLLMSIALLYVFSSYLIKHSYLFKALFLKDAYHTYLTNPYIGVIIRGLLYILQFASLYLVCVITPVNRKSFSQVGVNSFFIYLIHSVVIYSLKMTYFKNNPIHNELSFTVFLLIISIAFCYMLTLKPFAYIGRKLTSVPMKYILKE